MTGAGIEPGWWRCCFRIHERLGNVERACGLYIQDMDFDAAKPMMEEVIHGADLL